MKRSIVIVFDVDDTAHDGTTIPDQDLTEGVIARLDEFYPIRGDVSVPENIRVAVTEPDSVHQLLAAADVGLEGAVDAGQDEQATTAAGQIVDNLRGTASHTAG